jgi:hypothetical protein
VRPLAPANTATVAWRGGGRVPSICAAIAGVFGPEIRTMPMPPRPGGVALATIVSGAALTVGPR